MNSFKYLKALLCIILATCLYQPLHAQVAASLLQLKVYHLKDATQKATVEDYLRKAYLPALHRAGMKNVGVFKPYQSQGDTSRTIYVLLNYGSFDKMIKMNARLAADKQLGADGASYLGAAFKTPPYQRIETILLTPFEMAKWVSKPALKAAATNRVYELRSYEGHTERISKNKIEMFNQGGEIALFARLNFNAIFYGEVISGSSMPNLMYMTAFEDKADRDAHWKIFGADTEWKKLSADPRYQNNVSKNVSLLLSPTAYSDL